MRLIEYIPDEVLQQPEAAKFVKVFDDIVEDKRVLVEQFARSFNPITLDKRAFLLKYLSDLGNMPSYISMTRQVLECMILHAYEIYGYKGTLRGLEQFIACVGQGTCTVDDSGLITLPNYIIPDDFTYGYLGLSDEVGTGKNGADFAAYTLEVDNDPPVGYPFLFLFEDNFHDLNGVVVINVYSSFSLDLAFQQYLRAVIPTMMPGYGTLVTVDINFFL